MKHPFIVILIFSNLFCMLYSSAQKNIRFRSNVQYPHTLSNLWGYVDSAGREYALVGVETGLAVVDVTNPDNPQSLFYVPNDTSLWQEPKVWGHYAYVTNEHKGGLLIVNLGFLPDSISFTHWSNVPGENFQKAHSCFIDENGIIYVNGTNLGNMFMCDLKPDPMNPTYLGYYDDYYVHDCFARNDTLYTSEIMNGQFSVIDVHDKANPMVITRQTTPYAFSHNTWLSDDSRYLFNTDEKKFAPVTSYDITDLNNITELDQYRHSDFDSSIAHNTYYRDGYLFTSYYRDGVTIVDAHQPDNLVEIAWYDTSPFSPADGFEGCWGVFPFFPSGNIICSDRQEGLFVLSPNLQRACYLQGTITDLHTNLPLPNIRVEIVGQPRFKTSNYTGTYKTGVADSGAYDVRFTDFNTYCQTVIVSGVVLHSGTITTLNQSLQCSFPNSIQNLTGSYSLIAMPTVFTGTTQIQWNGSGKQCTTLSLFDNNGKLLKQEIVNTPNATWVLGNGLPTGMYLLTAQQGSIYKTIKLIKQ